ncbi:Hypothetical protein HVR_LOCUS1348 [uncultured virus]|nr:Hypothetical protein HVR_LOCUS1348 [uncultured virus]
MAYNEYPTKKKSADPLPYIIIFAILFLIALGLLTWVLGTFYKSHACSLYPNIWCSDNWSCNTVCPGGNNPVSPQGQPVNPCFGNAAYVGPGGGSASGLSSCIFGPTAMGATACFATPSGGDTGGGGTGLACDCPTGMSGIQNCFNGCAINLTSIPTGAAATCCCNDPNNPACAAVTGATGVEPTGICLPTSGGSSFATPNQNTTFEDKVTFVSSYIPKKPPNINRYS